MPFVVLVLWGSRTRSCSSGHLITVYCVRMIGIFKLPSSKVIFAVVGLLFFFFISFFSCLINVVGLLYFRL